MTQELAEKLIHLTEKGFELASGQVTELTKEYLNYLLFEAGLALVKSLAFIFIPIFIFKLLGTLKAYFNENKDALAILGAIRGVCLIGTLLLLLQITFSDLKHIGKILIAPKVYILEEGSKLLKK